MVGPGLMRCSTRTFCAALSARSRWQEATRVCRLRRRHSSRTAGHAKTDVRCPQCRRRRSRRRDALDRRFNKKHGRHDGIPGIGMSVDQTDELVGEYASDKEPREIRNAHNADRQSQQSRKVTRIRILVTMHHPRLDVRTRSAREWARKTGECAAYSEHGYLPRIGEIQQKPRVRLRGRHEAEYVNQHPLAGSQSVGEVAPNSTDHDLHLRAMRPDHIDGREQRCGRHDLERVCERQAMHCK